MPLATINRNSTADVTMTFPSLTSKSYKAQFSRFDVDASTPEIDVTTFAGEVNGEFEQGPNSTTVTFAGITKTGVDGTNGTAAVGILLSNPQNVVGTWQFHTGASVASTWNFNRCTVSRPAGVASTFAGFARSTATVTIAWPIA